jgi:hypothetical protein
MQYKKIGSEKKETIFLQEPEDYSGYYVGRRATLKEKR